MLPKFTTSNVGRPKPWSKQQQEVIDSSLPKWHEFALVQQKDVDGHDPRLVNWKKAEADRLLKLPSFKELPLNVSFFTFNFLQVHNVWQMTLAVAKETIIRKFTNYRNNYKRKHEHRLTEVDLYEAMRQAGSALVDLKSYSKGRNLFKKRHFDEISTLRDDIVRKTPGISRVGAFQKALKTLWSNTDQQHWEAQAVGEAEDIYE